MSKYRQISKVLENSLLKFCILSILTLFVVQFFKLDKEVTVFLEQDMGNKIMETSDEEVGYLIFKRSKGNFNDVEIIINNENKYKFNEKDEITLKIHEEDLIEVNGSMYNDNIDISIIGVTKNIDKPMLNSKLTTRGNIQTFGTVKLKNIE